MSYRFPRVGKESLSTWYTRVARERANGGPPESLEEELSQFHPDASELQIFRALISDFRDRGNDEAAEHRIRAEVQADPRNPRKRILLMGQYLHFSKEYTKALTASDDALLEAERSGMFLREVLGVRARIALARNDENLLGQSIEEIIGLGLLKDAIDVGVERDFIDRAPAQAISTKIRQQYEELYQEYWP